MCKIIINGKFMADRMQGIVRYAREIVTAMDSFVPGTNVTLLLPPNAINDLELQNIRCEFYGRRTGILWEQTDLAEYVRNNKGSICVNLCNVAPILSRPGITVIHDIMYKVNPDDYTTLRNRLSRQWHTLQYWLLCRREIRIITVSEFSKSEIEKWYPVTKGKTEVVPSGWQHILSYEDSYDWQKKYPFLKPKEFYFSLSTLSRNKNGKWIMDAARRNPDAQFAVGGKYYETEEYVIPSNVHMLGFISDEDSCSLMKNCKAFIHPSLYEGFGLPPLEALALGASVISSNSTSLPEVLDNCAHYIDPQNPNVNLDSLLAEPVAAPTLALDRFSWNQSAKKIISIIDQLQ